MQFFYLLTAFVMLFSTSMAQSVIIETQEFTSAVTETLTATKATATTVISRVSTFKKVVTASKKVITSDYTTTFCPVSCFSKAQGHQHLTNISSVTYSSCSQGHNLLSYHRNTHCHYQ